MITTIGLDEIDRKLRVFLEGASQIRAGLNLGQKMKEWSRAVHMKALSQIFQTRFRLRNIGLWGYLGAAIPARKSIPEPGCCVAIAGRVRCYVAMGSARPRVGGGAPD